MSNNPINLALRFCLEMAGLVAFARWATLSVDGVLGVVLAIVVIVIASAIWGVFRLPEDSSHGGGAPVPVPGIVRLAIEAVFFSAAVVGLSVVGDTNAALILAVLVIGHYLVSYDRVIWMLAKR